MAVYRDIYRMIINLIEKLRSDWRSKFVRQMCSDLEVFESKGVRIKRHHCIYIYSIPSIIAVNGGQNPPQKVKIREVAALLYKSP